MLLQKLLSNMPLRFLAVLVLAMSAAAYSQSAAPWTDPSPHHVSFVTVDKDIRLEVLDWGGSGKPMVLLAGGGNTAHVFDDFAPKLTSEYHVYGITRRGFGASAYQGSDYGADRLGDDVLAVLDSLKLNKPILVGHSLAGEELSSVGSRYPDRVTALVYLEAAYPYAFDNGKGANLNDLRIHGPVPPASEPADRESFSAFGAWQERMAGVRLPESELRQGWEATPDGKLGKRRIPAGAAGLGAGMKKFTTIPVPALVIFAVPHALEPWIRASSDPAVQEAAKNLTELETRVVERQAKAIEEAVPTAHVVRLAGANHLVFLSNPADVLREMRAFLSQLKSGS